MALPRMRAAFGGAMAVLAAGCVTDGAGTTAPKTAVEAGRAATTESAAPAAEPSAWDKFTTSVGDGYERAKKSVTDRLTSGEPCGRAASMGSRAVTSAGTGLLSSATGTFGYYASSILGNPEEEAAQAVNQGAAEAGKEGCAQDQTQVPAREKDYIVKGP